MKKPLGKIVAENLRRLMKERNLNQPKLAALSGASQTQIGNVLREKSSPTVDFLDKIAAGLRVEIVELIVDQDQLNNRLLQLVAERRTPYRTERKGDEPE